MDRRTCSADGGARMFHDVSTSINWVNPTVPIFGWYPDRKERGRARGQRMPEKANAGL